MSTSRIIIDRKVEPEFTKRYLEKVKRIRIGEGLCEDTFMGPLIEEGSIEKWQFHNSKAKEEGAEVLIDGRVLTDGEYAERKSLRDAVRLSILSGTRRETRSFTSLTTIDELPRICSTLAVWNCRRRALFRSIAIWISQGSPVRTKTSASRGISRPALSCAVRLADNRDEDATKSSMP